MARARALIDLRNKAATSLILSARASASVTLFETDGTTPLAQTLYDAVTGGNVVANPFLTNGDGQRQLFVNKPQRAILSSGGEIQYIEFVSVDSFGDTSMYGYPDPQTLKVWDTIASPSTIKPIVYLIGSSKGDNTTFIGHNTLKVEARDRDDVTALNKGVLYGISVNVVPIQARNNVPYDDVAGITISNTTGTLGARGTDALYFSHNSFAFTGTSEWYSVMTSDANAEIGIQLAGRLAVYGIDMANSTLVTAAAIRFPNAAKLVWRNAAGSADLDALRLDSSNILQVGTGATSITLGKATTVTTSGDTDGLAVEDTGANGANIRMTGNGGAAPGKYIRVINGIFQILNNAYTTALLALNDGGQLTVSNGLVISAGPLDHDGTTVGLYGVTPVTRASAYTQTYATADKTHANPTSATLTDNSGGTGGTTLAAIAGGGAGCENATKDAVASLAAQVNALRVDLLDAKQFINSVVDDLQAIGIVQ